MNSNNSSNNVLRLTPDDFEEVFRDKFNPHLRKIIAGYDFVYRPVTAEERKVWLEKIKETLASPFVVRAGEHRLSQWESGWSENLRALRETKNAAALIPRYFGKYNVVRWKQDFITPLSDNFEYNTLAVIEDWLFAEYLRDVEAIYEFGSGTAHNLSRARRANRNAKLYGLDWAESSKMILEEAVRLGLLSNAAGLQFNIFSPDLNVVLEKNSGIFTAAALEQVGDRFVPFVDYLLFQKPKICIHIEPIAELLDESNLLDRLSVEYFKKRNYLRGFLEHLRQLEKDRKIVIHKAQRTHIGSLFIEGYSVVVWSPL